MSASLFDSGAWIAAIFPRHPHHALSQRELAAATVSAPVCFCRATENSFLRLLTTTSLLRQYDAAHMTNRDALTHLQMLLARPEISEAEEPIGTAALWHRLASRDSASPKVWMDAYLAAFAITGDLRLVTLDRDFKIYAEHGLALHLLTP